MQNILIRSLSRSLSLVLSHLPPWNTLQIDWFLLHFCTRFVLLWAENMLSLHIFSTLWHQPFMCSFCCCCCSMRLLPWCLLFTYALFHVLFDAIQSSVMHFYDTFEIFCSAAVCSLSHTHTHTLLTSLSCHGFPVARRFTVDAHVHFSRIHKLKTFAHISSSIILSLILAVLSISSCHFFFFFYPFRSQFAATFGILSDTLYRFCFAALLLYLSFIEIEKCSFCARFAA